MEGIPKSKTIPTYYQRNIIPAWDLCEVSLFQIYHTTYGGVFKYYHVCDFLVEQISTCYRQGFPEAAIKNTDPDAVRTWKFPDCPF